MSKTTTTTTAPAPTDEEVWRLVEPEELRNKYPVKNRDTMDESSFCGPHKSFPILDAEDVIHAAMRLHNAPAGNQASIKKCIIGKAHSHGWKLPDTWTGGDDGDGDSKKDRVAEEPDIARERDPGLIIDSEGNHAAFTGLHIHHHNAFGVASDGDGQHRHEHEHSNDAAHNHSHHNLHLDGSWQAQGEGTQKSEGDPDITRTLPSETQIYVPILRIDKAKREVVLRATAEDLDSYGTVIGFEGSKDAFSKWRGNIREMHDSTKAVGRAVRWEPVEDERAIDLTLRVSRGAEDTWQKVLDGTLAGGSIGARNGKWGKRKVGEKEVPFLERYDLVEVSLVDNPSCPGCEVKVVRADNLATDVLDFTEEEEEAEEPQSTTKQPEDISRSGARIATNTMASLHRARDHGLQAVREQLGNCSCSECANALRILDPDGDGDVDIVPSLDTDHDYAGSSSTAVGGDAAAGDGSGIMKFVEAEIRRHMTPIVQRMNGIAARFASTDFPHIETIPATLQVAEHHTSDPEITRRLDAMAETMHGVAASADLVEVRSLLSEVKELAAANKALAEQIASQPMPGGPIVNSAVLRGAGLPSQQAGNNSFGDEVAMVAELAKSGILNKNQQVEAALYLERKRAGGR